MEDLERGRGIQIVGFSATQLVTDGVVSNSLKDLSGINIISYDEYYTMLELEKEFMIRSIDYVMPELFLKKSKNKPVYGNSYVKRKFRWIKNI